MTPGLSIVGALLIGVLLWLANGIRQIGAVSAGEMIGARERTALILVDLQTVFWDDGPYPETDRAGAKAAILDEIRAARENGHPVIALRQEWSIPSTKVIARLLMKGQAVAGTAGTDVATPFANLADHELVKRVQDGFETGELDPLLSTLGVGRLRIVGLDYSYCVQKTALAARARGFDVVVVEGGTLAAAARGVAKARMAAQGVVFA